MTPLILTTACLLALTPADQDDKSQFTLANPTPRHLWRDMPLDRPDITESPRTVDAGAVQLEMSFIEYTRDRERGRATTTLAAAPFNLKLGILNDVDLHFGFDPYLRIDAPDARATSGVGDLVLRLKYNLWGNDEGETALGIMPFIKIPTSADRIGNNSIEGGIALPYAMDLRGGWDLGLMAEFQFLREDDTGDFAADFLHSIALGRDLVGDLGGFIEYVGIAPLTSPGRYRALLSTGLTYTLTPDLVLDGGVILGLTERDTDDLTLSVGMSTRF